MLYACCCNRISIHTIRNICLPFICTAQDDIDTHSPGREEEAILDDAIAQSAAAALVSLDKRACARTLIRKANAVLEEILIPMSLPWSHQVEPLYRNVARDIDEMPGMLNADNEIPGHEHGIFKQNERDRGLPRTVHAAVQRSLDPGVMELTLTYKASQAQRHSAYSPKPYDPREEDPSLPGEMSLRMYQEVQRRKKPRLAMESVNQRKTMVSLRLCSSSSRSTIFDLQDNKRIPLLLPAVFPKHFQDGCRKNEDSAVLEQINDLGSYNCRPLTFSRSLHSTGRNRLFVGRNRIIWSEKEKQGAKSQRPTFRSILTGQRLESGTQKRPINLKIGIRLNGVLLSSDDPSAVKVLSTLDPSFASNGPFSYPARVVKCALNEACPPNEAVMPNRGQCSLDFDRFLFNISGDLQQQITGKRPHNLVYLIRQQLTVAHTIRLRTKTQNQESSSSKLSLTIVPPWLDCAATEDGIIRVVCSKSGTMSWEGMSSHTSSTKVPTQSMSNANFLVSEMARETKKCAICWSDTDPLDDGNFLKCKVCQLPIHAACMGGKSSTDWICNSCELQHDQKVDATCAHSSIGNPICIVCGHAGGVLEKCEAKRRHIHTVCRIWCSDALADTDSSESKTENDTITPRCHLCMNGSSSVVRCAADGCCVQFHPMCAVLYSAASRINHSQLWKGDAKTRDALLCTQFQLSLLHTTFREARTFYGESVDLPVGFCGFHNRNRAEDFYGMYPGGCYLEGAVRVPPRIVKK